MLSFFRNKTDAVQFAEDLNQNFGQGCASIMSISPEVGVLYAVCCASGATVSLSEDTVDRLAWPYLEQLQII